MFSMVVADDLVPIWHQVICNHHAGYVVWEAFEYVHSFTLCFMVYVGGCFVCMCVCVCICVNPWCLSARIWGIWLRLGGVWSLLYLLIDLSSRRNFCHWLHQKLSFWQILVQIVMKIFVQIMTFLFHCRHILESVKCLLLRRMEL